VLTPSADAPDGLDAQLYGELAAVLAMGDPDKQKLPAVGVAGSQLSVVAGARNHLDLLLSAAVLATLPRPRAASTGNAAF
jgi:hypothetical protein